MLVTQDERMLRVLATVERVACSDAALLIEGETGVGKELVADHFHRSGPRPDGPCIKVSLAAMPADLIESELFGHERGAFTGAHAERKGLFELAQNGTIFLDDIDDVPVSVQVKLLRVLELGQVHPVGAGHPHRVDVRWVSASKVPLRDLVDRGAFRADFYHRISCCPVSIPPLRERKGDIPLLLGHFFCAFGSTEQTVDPDALSALLAYDWPGNVRELRNVAQRLTIFAGRTVHLEDLPSEVILRDRQHERGTFGCVQCHIERGLSYADTVECLESSLLRRALAESGGNVSSAARLLGLPVSTVRDRLRRLNVAIRYSSGSSELP